MNWETKLKPVMAEIERDAYARGWDDAVASILRTVQNPNTPQQPRLPLHDMPRKGVATAGDSGKTIIEIVEAYTKDHPGQRGNAIVAFVGTQMPDKDKKSLDRTVRTALVRLKTREKLRSIGGRWYHPEGASEIPL